MNSRALPTKELLLHACRAVPREDHPLLRIAHLLAGLHERRLSGAPDLAEIDSGRARLVLAADRWVATELPVARGGAQMHTETLGAVLDRLTQYCAYAHARLDTAPEWMVHDAWERLAELALGYQDLAGEVLAGVRRLPCPFRPGELTGGGIPDDSGTVALEHAVRRYLRYRGRSEPAAHPRDLATAAGFG